MSESLHVNSAWQDLQDFMSKLGLDERTKRLIEDTGLSESNPSAGIWPAAVGIKYGIENTNKISDLLEEVRKIRK